MNPTLATWAGAMAAAGIIVVVIFALTFALADLLTPGNGRGRR